MEDREITWKLQRGYQFQVSPSNPSDFIDPLQFKDEERKFVKNSLILDNQNDTIEICSQDRNIFFFYSWYATGSVKAKTYETESRSNRRAETLNNYILKRELFFFSFLTEKVILNRIAIEKATWI